MSEERAILLIEPDARLRAALRRDLERAGYRVREAAGITAEGLGQEDRRALLLVLARDGVAGGRRLLLDWASRGAPPLPVILTRPQAGLAEGVSAVREGACDYLALPVAADLLLGSVRRALAPAGPPPRPPLPGDPSEGADKPFLTRDPRLLEMLQTARRVAASTATVLIRGESGTGKELLASFIHRHGLHPEEPYVAVNCAALPETLAESELFGHERGAFTGAVARKTGKFELARRGTLVLDEIGEMPLALQAKLLRALQERAIDRLGGAAPVPIEARVIAITHRDLGRAVAEGAFREDLYFRIQVVELVIPPLRDRPADIGLLADHFLSRFCSRHGRPSARFSDEARRVLSRHDWRGNVRELENRVERAVLLAEDGLITPAALGFTEDRSAALSGPAPFTFRPGTTVSEMERQLILNTLREVNHNRTRAAELLGISIRTLRNKLREYREAGVAAAGVQQA
ncbi:MAG: sigma-54 dependent transcriptional regulator [Desulfobacterales bacterium]